MAQQTAIVTGSAGFIGFHLCSKLLKDGWRVVGVDALTDYYDVSLKRRRQEILQENPAFVAINERLEASNSITKVFAREHPQQVVHLAAQAGVRYSIDNPRSYLESNVCGTFELLEAARSYPPRHLLIASTSSAYGANTEMPYSETQRADYQMSFYAATKKATEVMAHSYSHIYNLPITAFRFFTVYGPWGRPDMALFSFTKSILEGKPIDVYNFGNMRRDFTYVEDVVRAIQLLMECIPEPPKNGQVPAGDSLSPVAPFRLVNIGNSTPVQLAEFINAIEEATGKTAMRNLLPMQQGDVPATWADTSLLAKLTGYKPETSVRDGVRRFVEWYRTHYNL